MSEPIYALRRWVAHATLPWFRYELPGWQRLSSWIGLPISNQALWAAAAPRTITGKTHGLRMRLYMQDWCERLTYFLGRYYELPVDLLIRMLVRPGDTYIDVGGNIGMATLMGAACTGPGGKIHTFEPHPAMVARIREMVELNALANVVVHPLGLSDETCELTLTTVAEANGWSTFGKVAQRDASYTYCEVTAKVARGDDVLPTSITGPVTVKIDVEGFEFRALKGMAGFVAHCHPAIITEVDDRLLKMAGASATQLFALLQSWGYHAYDATATGKGNRARLVLRRNDSPETAAVTVAWIHPRSAFVDRVDPAIEHNQERKDGNVDSE